jgi:RNA polymerase sigma-70 factor (ECF subfamily)
MFKKTTMKIEKIHAEFHNLLYQYIVSRVKEKEDAADVLQEVFIKISSKLDTLSNGAKLKGWIFAITRNAIIDYYRKKAGNISTDISDEIADELMAEADTDMTKGLDKCIVGFIQELPDEYRGIIIDSEIKGVKQKDLAGKYNLAYPSVRSRVQRGRTRLKEMLLNCCSITTDSRGNILERSSKNGCSTVCGDGCA